MKGLNPFRKDAFGHFVLLKKFLISLVGMLTYARYNIVNNIHIEGMEKLNDLPDNNVLFLSNHQTYYADVIAFYHIFCAVKFGFKNKKTLPLPIYLLRPRSNAFYIAAEETMMQSGLFPKMLAYAGALTVKRSWRAKGKAVDRGVDRKVIDKIRTGLDSGWVVSFPQGTTSPYAPIRKGAAHMVQDYRPVVVPVVIDGFRRAFDKKGLRFKKRGVTLSVRFKDPLDIDYENNSLDEVVEEIRCAIEQEDVMARIRSIGA